MAALRPITIDVDDTPPEAVVEQILDAIGRNGA
jgi:hypothetical protein